MNHAQQQFQKQLDILEAMAEQFNITFADAIAAWSKPPEHLRRANALRDKDGTNPEVLIDYYRTIFYEKKIVEQFDFITRHWPSIEFGMSRIEKIGEKEFKKALKAQESRKVGGETRAKQLKAEKDANHQLIKDAHKALPKGIKPHQITGRLAIDLKMPTDYVRKARVEMGLLKKRK